VPGVFKFSRGEKKEKERSALKNSLTTPALLEMSGNRCRLRRSTQHWLEVYSPESGILKFFSDVFKRSATWSSCACE
jgi:hypothetical protein